MHVLAVFGAPASPATICTASVLYDHIIGSKSSRVLFELLLLGANCSWERIGCVCVSVFLQCWPVNFNRCTSSRYLLPRFPKWSKAPIGEMFFRSKTKVTFYEDECGTSYLFPVTSQYRWNCSVHALAGYSRSVWTYSNSRGDDERSIASEAGRPPSSICFLWREKAPAARNNEQDTLTDAWCQSSDRVRQISVVTSSPRTNHHATCVLTGWYFARFPWHRCSIS